MQTNSQDGDPAAKGESSGSDPLKSRVLATAFDPRDLVPEPVFCFDAEGRLTWMNQAAEDLTGYSTAELLGKPFAILIAGPRRRRLASYFVRRLHLRGQRTARRDAPMIRRDGGVSWAAVQVRRVRTLHGRVGYVACAHELHGMAYEVERLRRETRELRAKVVEAAAAAQLKDDFLAAMGDEIRTPMDGLLSMSRLLLESSLDRDQRTFVEMIQGSGESLLTMLSDIMDFSRIEAGRLEVESRDFDLRVTLDGVAAGLAPSANARGVGLARTVHHDVPSHLRGDPGRLRQVLTSVVRVLLRSMTRGEISLWTTLIEESPRQVMLRFSVGWRGEVPEGLIEALEVFRRADAPRARRLAGSSLALAISRHLVSLMGGEVGVEEQPAGGSLWIQIPFERQSEGVPAPPLPEIDLGGMRVLVADPSIGMRLALSETLSGWGCLTDEAQDGDSALTLLREAARQGRPYRAALIDMQLPGTDGEAIARAIRDEPTLEDTPLLLLTNVGRRGDAARAQEWGYSAYLVKPFEPSYLYDALVEVVHQGSPPAEAPTGGAQVMVTRHSLAERRRQRLRILVVEDNSVNQLVAVSALRRAGYQPDAAASASEAIQTHALQRYDLIFMDLELPDLNGIEATDEIRRMEEGTGRSTPVVAVTGHPKADVWDRCMAVGMKDVMTKPIDLDAMCAAVGRWARIETPESATPWEGAAGTDLGDGLAGSRPAALGGAPLAESGDPPAPEAGLQAGTSGPAVADLAASALAGLPAPPATVAALRPVGSEKQKPTQGEEAALDEARLESSCMGNSELRSILINTFMNHIRPRLGRLREAAEAGDAGAVEFEAHGVKGMCATIGAVGCVDAFARLERLGHEGRLEAMGPLLDYAEIEVTRVEAVLGPRAEAA